MTATFTRISNWANRHYANRTTGDTTELADMLAEAVREDPAITSSAAHAVAYGNAERESFLNDVALRTAKVIQDRSAQHSGATDPFSGHEVRLWAKATAGDLADAGMGP